MVMAPCAAMSGHERPPMRATRLSPSRWMQRHLRDPYVRAAARDPGTRSRAYFKLEQLQRRHEVLRPGQCVVDLGASPGGWSSFAHRVVGPTGRVVGVDLLETEPLEGVTFLVGDFTETLVHHMLIRELAGRSIDVVLSDMAPNTTGDRDTDHFRSIDLALMALDFSRTNLSEGGAFVCKFFQGPDDDELRKAGRDVFRTCKVVKPEASRKESRESFLLGFAKRS